MKPVNDVPLTRHLPSMHRRRGVILTAWLLAASLTGGACADDLAPTLAGVDAGTDDGTDDRDAGSGGPEDVAADMNVAFDLGPPPTEPPLTIPDCPADGGTAAGATCCASALGFEDGSTSHFLTPTCCRMALSKPHIASMPTACGRGALRIDADFRATDASSLCDQIGEAPACAFREGEVSRAVLASLDLTGLTVSAMVFVDGPALPTAPVLGKLFVLGRGGLIEGTALPITQTGVWTRLEFRIADDGAAPGADIRVIGIRIGFHGQAWRGHVYIDEITWL